MGRHYDSGTDSEQGLGKGTFAIVDTYVLTQGVRGG